MTFKARYCSVCKSTHIERWGVSLVCRRLAWDGGHVDLTPTQRALLWRLMLANRGLRLTTPELIDSVWGDDEDGGPLAARIAIGVHLHRLRVILREARAPVNVPCGTGGRGPQMRYELISAA